MEVQGCLELVERVAWCEVAWREAGVVEVEIGAVGHAELFHDAARGLVADGGDGDNFESLRVVEGEVEDGSCAFGGEAAALDVRG